MCMAAFPEQTLENIKQYSSFIKSKQNIYVTFRQISKQVVKFLQENGTLPLNGDFKSYKEIKYLLK